MLLFFLKLKEHRSEKKISLYTLTLYCNEYCVNIWILVFLPSEKRIVSQAAQVRFPYPKSMFDILLIEMFPCPCWVAQLARVSSLWHRSKLWVRSQIRTYIRVNHWIHKEVDQQKLMSMCVCLSPSLPPLSIKKI